MCKRNTHTTASQTRMYYAQSHNAIYGVARRNFKFKIKYVNCYTFSLFNLSILYNLIKKKLRLINIMGCWAAAGEMGSAFCQIAEAKTAVRLLLS